MGDMSLDWDFSSAGGAAMDEEEVLASNEGSEEVYLYSMHFYFRGRQWQVIQQPTAVAAVAAAVVCSPRCILGYIPTERTHLRRKSFEHLWHGA